MRHHRPSLAALALLTLLLTTLAAPTMATILVTTTADEAGENLDACSLREAVLSVTGGSAFGGCAASPGDSLVLLGAGTHRLVSGRIEVSRPMTLIGEGPSLTTVEPGEGFDSELFFVSHDSPGGGSTLEGMTLRGMMGQHSALLYASMADLTVKDLVIRDNVTTGVSTVLQLDQGPGKLSFERVIFERNVIFESPLGVIRCGGAPHAGGRPSLQFEDVLFRDNLSRRSSGDSVGGALGSRGCDLFLTNVTFDHNQVRSDSGNAIGGALALSTSEVGPNFVELTNVTFFGNSATIGGGLYQEAGPGSSLELTLTNVTFSANTASVSGDHFYQSSGSIALRNVLFGPSSGSNCDGSPSPVVVQLDGNFDTDASCGVERTVADPGLAEALSQTSGFTPTLVLLPGSPAIDNGTNLGCPETDQRGARRPADGDENGSETCDIGAFEVSVEIFSDGFESGDLSAWLDPIG